jgi:hypothetical protein
MPGGPAAKTPGTMNKTIPAIMPINIFDVVFIISDSFLPIMNSYLLGECCKQVPIAAAGAIRQQA